MKPQPKPLQVTLPKADMFSMQPGLAALLAGAIWDMLAVQPVIAAGLGAGGAGGIRLHAAHVSVVPARVPEPLDAQGRLSVCVLPVGRH